MPNTLCHLGVQALCSKALFRDSDLKWIGVGCILPDLPWISQRIIAKISDDINIFDLRLYCLIQASLFFCLILAAAISLPVRSRAGLWRLLAFNALLHLLLDSLQTKWGNGVHLLAPWSWDLLNFGLFWPEDPINRILTLGGAVALVYYGRQDYAKEVVLAASPCGLSGSALLLLIYCLLPLALFQGPLQADNHYIATLRDPATRSGKYVEMDRVAYKATPVAVRPLGGELLKVIGRNLPETDGVISLRGRFLDNHTIRADFHHSHDRLRDFSTLLGLFGVLFLWLLAFLKKKVTLNQSYQ